MHIPILSPEKGFNESVDYAYLGAWNFKKEIMNKEKGYLKRGGRFITHVPKVKIYKIKNVKQKISKNGSIHKKN